MTDKLRQHAPHGKPLYNMINDKRLDGHYTGMDPDQFQQSVQLDETHLRRRFKSLGRHEPYSPWVDGQVVDLVADEEQHQSYAINAVQPATNNTGLGVSGMVPSESNPVVTDADLFRGRREMEVAQSKKDDDLAREVQAIYKRSQRRQQLPPHKSHS